MAVIDWRHSFAKEQLVRDLTLGEIPLDAKNMGPLEVYNLPHRPYFRDYVYNNFRTNLNSLRKLILEKQQHAVSDSEALDRDLKMFPRPQHNHRFEPRWEGSAAQESLIFDVGTAAKEGKRLTVKDIYDTRDEYQDFMRRTIQKHIYQEESAIKFLVYVDWKKKEDKKKKAKKQKQREKES